MLTETVQSVLRNSANTKMLLDEEESYVNERKQFNWLKR